MAKALENVEFLRHASFKIMGSKIIYTDPYNIQPDQKADIILITHSHYDHCSPQDIKKIAGEETVIVCSRDCSESLEGLSGHIIGLEPFQNANVSGVVIDAVPAYNINKNYHPRENNWNGYIFTLDGARYYHPGDTDRIPEMKDLKADVVFLPVGGTYTMDCNEALSVVSIINPRYAVPMHYGTIVGSEDDARQFTERAGNKGILLPPTYT